MATPKDREKEAKVKELAEALYVMSRAAGSIDMMSPNEAFGAAERFYEESERRWEVLK